MMNDIVVSAPGKVILHGEHSVVYGKVAVASSLNLRCFLRASLAEDDGLLLDLPDVNIFQKWSLSALQSDLLPHLDFGAEADGSPSPPSDKSLQVLRQFVGIQNGSTETRELAVVSFLFLYCAICGKERPLPPLHLRLISQLPVGAGLGSSAAFSVCLAAMLLQLSGQTRTRPSDTISESAERQGDAEPSKSSSVNDWSEADRLLINRWAFLGEKIIHGQPSGIDNSVSSLGGAICFKNKVIDPVKKMPRLRILLINTKVPRSTKMLVANVRKRHDKFPEVMVPVLDSLDGLAGRSLKAYNMLYDQPCSAAAYSELEELIDMNQQLLNTLGVGHPSLDAAVAVTARHGLHTKLTGAGGGGCAYTLLNPETSADSIEAVREELRQCGHDCWVTSVGAPGVTVHRDPHDDPSVPRHLFLPSQ
ncbi:mevalonate kinase-like [Babylonia areolata]|uniref:mevalonate kinase-like n=1 Tax=Babylonia areolata TaxID=304850 RepID=UPI003FCF2D8B